VDWIQLAQERTQWWDLVNISKELWGFIKDSRSSRLAEQQILKKDFALRSWKRMLFPLDYIEMAFSNSRIFAQDLKTKWNTQLKDGNFYMQQTGWGPRTKIN
jgi:hypothetical protein